MNPGSGRDEGRVVRMLRHFMLAILAIAMTGTFIELLLMNHYEDRWQMIPLALLALAALAFGWYGICSGRASIRAIQVVMVFFLAGGIAGLVLHYRASAAFYTEGDPTIQGWHLVLKVFQSKAPPALAPALFLQMGLIGLAYTYRHPSLGRAEEL